MGPLPLLCMLLPTCQECYLWRKAGVDVLPFFLTGVYDAIRKRYLKTLFFGVATDPGGTNLLEVWLGGLCYWHFNRRACNNHCT